MRPAATAAPAAAVVVGGDGSSRSDGESPRPTFLTVRDRWALKLNRSDIPNSTSVVDENLFDSQKSEIK